MNILLPLKILVFLGSITIISLSLNLIISSDKMLTDKVIVLDGNLIINKNTSLELKTTIIELDCNYNGQNKIFVDKFCSLILHNRQIQHNDL